MTDKVTYIKSCLILAYLMFLSTAVCSQSYADEIDQLRDKLSNHIYDDTARVDILNDLSYAYRRTSATKIDTFAKAALSLAHKLAYDKGKAIAYKNLGISTFKLGGKSDDVLELYQKCYEMASSAKDYYNQSACLNNIGLSHRARLNYSESIKTFQHALEIHKENLELDRLRLIILGNIGQAFLSMEDFENADIYLSETLNLAKEIDNEQIEVMYAEDYAKVRYYKGEIKEAIISIKEHIPIAFELGDFETFAQASAMLTKMLIEENRLEEAELYIADALDIAHENSFEVQKCNLMLSQSKIIARKEHPQKALQIAQQAYDCASNTSYSYQQMLAAKNLLETHLVLGNAFEADQMFKIYDELNHQHFDLEQQKTYAALEVQYQNNQKETENKLLRAQKLQDNATIKVQRVIGGSLILSGLLLSSFIFLAYRSKRNQNNLLDNKVKERTEELNDSNRELEISNRQLEKSNEELEQFAYIASHDLKQPLNTIISFSGLLQKELAKQPEEKSQVFLQYILNGSNQMKNLIEDILEYSRINKEVKNYQELNLVDLIEDVKNSISDLIHRKQARIIIESDLPILKYEKTKLYLLIKNIIENGIKYNESNPPIIKIKAQLTNDYLRMSFIDNGIGIEEQYFPKLFKMFSRLHNQNIYEGTGLGLSLCKKIVENMGGKIYLKSNVGLGSIFFVDIPSRFLVDGFNIKDDSDEKLKEKAFSFYI